MFDDESTDATLTEDSAEDTGSVDWQKRYTDTQAEYTKNQQALADERKVWEDEQALLARVQEKFPHLMAEEDETEDEAEGDLEDTTPDPSQFVSRKEFEDFQAWRNGIDGERGETQFKNDLAEELGDREVPAKVHDWIKDRTIALGANRKALKQAVAEFEEIQTELGSKKKPKPRVPHVPAGGSAATDVKDFSSMTRSQIDDYMVERARALEAQ